MTLEFVKTFLTPELLRSQVKRLTLCGDVGDPIYCKEFLDICRYFKTENPQLHLYIITNGSHKKPSFWTELGSILNEHDAINFSVDGYDQESNNLYRVNSKFSSIIDGIIALRESNKQVFINWAAIVFSFNENHLTSMQEYAKSLGCDNFQITKSTKFGSVYGGWGGETDPLEPSAEWVSSTHRYERSIINLSGRHLDNSAYLEHNKQKYIEIKEQYKDKPITPLCEIGNRGLYVNAAGNVYPCSWVSFPYTSLSHGDKTINYQDSFIAKNLSNFNLNTRKFIDILNDPLWNKCSANFNSADKTWVECAQKCSTSTVDEKYAVGWETN